MARKDTKKEEKPLRLRGWLSTDEEEIERRRERAQVEPLSVEALDEDDPVFGTFRVGSAQGSAYEVEIRSLTQRDNSCGCPDHLVNGLGTCKHIETVLARVGRRSRTQSSSPRVEVFLR
ncbi:MAG TPA: hypothetical protein VKM72_33075, partial [Thermoanaerobaculia bacterium]|nr:hypothetical protein [Thermoanaerobaculia bacterium]